MKRITLILLTAITITAFANQTASAAGKHKYVSPDHQMKAVVSPVAPKHKKSVESRVDIYDADGKLVSTVDYSSPDGEHGMGVVRAAWTPDSQFFVYSMASSGGHQPWKSPTWFFIRSSGKTQGLEQSLGKPVLSPNFSLKAPNTVIIETSKKSPMNEAPEITEDVKLAGLPFKTDAQPLQPRTQSHPGGEPEVSPTP
jgi:hypothetical protein